jgi:hypothetical protein
MSQGKQQEDIMTTYQKATQTAQNAKLEIPTGKTFEQVKTEYIFNLKQLSSLCAIDGIAYAEKLADIEDEYPGFVERIENGE